MYSTQKAVHPCALPTPLLLHTSWKQDIVVTEIPCSHSTTRAIQRAVQRSPVLQQPLPPLLRLRLRLRPLTCSC